MNRKNALAKWTLPTIVHPETTKCIQIEIPDEPFYIAAFRGAMLHLQEAYKWADDEAHTAKQVALVWRDIIDNMDFGCGVPDDDCRNFGTPASFITWEPQNPFTEPDLVPDGYILPPFRVLKEGSPELLLGYEIGDVLTDLSRFWGGTGVITNPESGFARFRISCTGVGLVQIYFINVPLGGMALVVADSDILTTNIIELQVDLFSIPIEDNEIIIHEVEFTTGGAHYIDVTFIPTVDDAATFFRYGGGMRKVKLCGFDAVSEEDMFDIRQKPDEPCIIEKSENGVDWVPAVNMQLCPPKLRKNNGEIEWFDDNTGTWEPIDTGDEREDGDAPVPYAGNPDGDCLAAENITAVYQSALTEIRAGITASRDLVAIAAGISGIMTAFMPIAVVTTIAFSLTAAALAVGGAGLDDMLDAESLANFKCSIFCNIEEDGSITADDFTNLRANMATWAATVELEIINIWLDAFGSVGLQRQAKAGGITTGDCSMCDCPEPPIDEFGWHIFVEASEDDSPNRTPFHIPAFGGSFSQPYGFQGTGYTFTQQTGTITDFGSGAAYHLASIVSVDLPSTPVGTTTVRAKRTSSNPSGSNQHIGKTYLRQVGGGWNDAQDFIATLTTIDVEEDIVVLDWSAFGFLGALDKVCLDFGSYPFVEIVSIIYDPDA